jgi:hypothetical protein
MKRFFFDKIKVSLQIVLSILLLYGSFSFQIKNILAGTIVDTDSFSLQNKMQIFSELDGISNLLWNSKKNKTVKKGFTTTFPGLPVIKLDDRNGDGRAEQFSYLADEKITRSQEFGFFYDLNNDGRRDYLVYNGGPLFTKDFSKMFWMNYHLIDANGDGSIDIFVYNGVNLTEENFYDEGVSAWIYDKDFDGIFEEAEYIGKDFVKKIEKKDGKFQIKSAMGTVQFDEKKDLSTWSRVINDIDLLLNK